MGIEHINPQGMNKPAAYTQVISVSGGRLVFIAGQTPVDANGNVVGVGDFNVQVDQVFKNLEIALKAVGATFADVVKVTQYIPNWNPDLHRPALVAARAAYMVPDRLPTSTL